MTAGQRRRWREDAITLGHLGAELESVELPTVRAGTLALVGLEIEERGRWDVDGATVDITADLVGMAVEAADDRALLEPGIPSDGAQG